MKIGVDHQTIVTDILSVLTTDPRSTKLLEFLADLPGDLLPIVMHEALLCGWIGTDFKLRNKKKLTNYIQRLKDYADSLEEQSGQPSADVSYTVLSEQQS
jgi:hypothetical protein